MIRGIFYYENHLTFWELKKLVSSFEINDYMLKIIEDPKKYLATEMIKPNSIKQKIILMLFKAAYFISPTYIWVLKKKDC